MEVSQPAKTIMTFWHRLALIISVSVICIGCDQAIKMLAANYLPSHSMHSYAFDTLRLGYTENVGAFLGLGNQLPEQYRFMLFTIGVGLILAGLLAYLLFNHALDRAAVLALSMMLAGGGSNFFDRAVNNGAVIDFMNVGLGPLRTGVFNVADMAIMFGCALFFYVQRE